MVPKSLSPLYTPYRTLLRRMKRGLFLMINQIVVKNFFRFTDFRMRFADDLNILVGNNEAGKSTVVRALEMVLSGRFGGRPLEAAISPYWFPRSVAQAYVTGIRNDPQYPIPAIVVESYFKDDPSLVSYQGNNNSLALKVPGIRLEISFNPIFEDEYKSYIESPDQVHSIPVEFFKVERLDFAGHPVLGVRPPVSVAIIDASTLRLQSGTDYYLQRSIEQNLTVEQRARLALAFRAQHEDFSADPALAAANEGLRVDQPTLRDREVALSMDVSTHSSWERSVVPHVDNVPFSQIGQGEQSAFKILLALQAKGENRHVIVVEEPENHLSHANLNVLLRRVRDRVGDGNQQLIITTHSSFVLNKLGIDKLRLLGDDTYATMESLDDDTQRYFLRLAGYDTLRLVLARAVILVEGPSDELIVQKAYLQRFKRLPLDDGIDVISVHSLAFKRFLSLASHLNRRAAVVTDLDTDPDAARARFEKYEKEGGIIRGFIGQVAAGRTLEPQLVASAGLATLNRILEKNFDDASELAQYMTNRKAECALRIFESPEDIIMPDYIEGAINHVTES